MMCGGRFENPSKKSHFVVMFAELFSNIIQDFPILHLAFVTEDQQRSFNGILNMPLSRCLVLFFYGRRIAFPVFAVGFSPL
jgi:hypothetical protein